MEKQMEMMANVNKTQLEMLSSLNNTVQKLASKMDEFSVGNPSGKSETRLPAQPEANPKAHCGAIESSEAITTRSGRVLGPILPTPSK